LFILFSGAFCWKYIKQTIITHSTIKAKIIALDATSLEVKWLQKNLIDIPIFSKPIPPISMHNDCQATITKVKNKFFNEKIDHNISWCYFF
jgi:hypothetical protein